MPALLLLLAAISIGLILSGASVLEIPLPGGLRLGNLLSALALASIAGAAVSLAPRNGRFSRLSLLVFAATVAWLPVSIALAGNLSLNFANGRGDVWLGFTATVLFASLLALAAAAVLRVHARFRGAGSV